MTREELKDFLDHKAAQYENPDFIETDPIIIPHHYSDKEDIEIMAFLMATIAWGNRKSIISSGNKLQLILGASPHDFLLNANFKDISFTHRTFNSQDLQFTLESLKKIYMTGGLEQAFVGNNSALSIKERIIHFRNCFLHGNAQIRTAKHISNPDKNSACKRINMFLRWMVRSESKGVDFGLWKKIDKGDLLLPLDVHTGNNARRLKLLGRNQNDWKALNELMIELRSMDSIDPVKYDFALFGLGVFEGF